jgi:alkanesulfonate monooxygenase SsuD/methylene tetrahydromethanopterin reductase-like flavin-dependent oxidoreductase (luciferase family)
MVHHCMLVYLYRPLGTTWGPERPGQVLRAIPGQGSKVPITLLGSSDFSARLAGMQGLPFAFAAHFAPEHLYAAAELYREEFRPSEVLRKPYFMVAVQVILAETDTAARRLFTTPQQRFLRYPSVLRCKVEGFPAEVQTVLNYGLSMKTVPSSA